MGYIRKSVFWLHLIAGVLGGLVIFVMCITGAALSFEKNITNYIESGQRSVKVGEKRLSTNELLANVLNARPNAKPASLLVVNDPVAAATVSLGREGRLFVDPYTGDITGEGSSGARKFFGTMTDLHRWIALSGDGRAIGKAITGVSNLLFLFLAITGIYIWFPRRLTFRHLRARLWFRSGPSVKADHFNRHNVVGFWCSLVLVVLTVTAAVISFQWAGNLLYTLTGNEVPPAQRSSSGSGLQAESPISAPANIDQLWSAAERHSHGAKSISLKLPVGKDAVFTIDEGRSWNVFARSTLTLDAATGSVVSWDAYEDRNSAQKLRSWFRFTHTGESFGIVGQFIGFAACLGGAYLVYTGLSLAARRFSRWLRGRSRRVTDTAL
ncbi:MAG: PepSY domain-containing protein [Pyrinomonadaceae bacterium]|nr:PepSY domain-containing protein [Pyrinomonadaceae bacterium]